MAAPHKLEFFLLRYVPDVVKEVFVNIGLVLLGDGFADVRFIRQWKRVHCLDADADVEMLEALGRDIRTQLRDVGNRDVFLKKIKEAFSNLVQISPTKGSLAESPAEEMKMLSRMYLETAVYSKTDHARESTSERQKIVEKMKWSFQNAGVWELILKGIAVAPYTGKGDSFQIDFGYRFGREIKLFQAVSLKKTAEPAFSLANRFPKIVVGIARHETIAAQLTAVVDEYDPRKSHVEYALDQLTEYGVTVKSVSEMSEIAGQARIELGLSTSH
jgi:hypothetical protein